MKHIYFSLALLLGLIFTFTSCTSDDLSIEDIQGEWKVTHFRAQFDDDISDYYPDRGDYGFSTLYIFSGNTVTMIDEKRNDYSYDTYEIVGSSLKFMGTGIDGEYTTGKVRGNKMTITNTYAGKPKTIFTSELVKK